VPPHGLVPARAERLLHARARVARARALEHHLTDAEAPSGEGVQVAPGDDEVAPQQDRIDLVTAEQRRQHRQVLGLHEGHVPAAPRVRSTARSGGPVAGEPEPSDRLRGVDHLDRSTLRRAQPDPRQAAGEGLVGDESAEIHGPQRRLRRPTPGGGAALLTLHFDYVSAASAVAVARLQRLVDDGGSVVFSGIDVLGLDATVPVTLDQLAELERVRPATTELGLTLHRPSRRPPTLAAHLVGGLAERAGVGAPWRRSCFAAYWERDADLGDDAVLVALGTDVGLDRGEVVAALDDRALRRQLRQRMVTARGRGIGGVPVLEVAGGTLLPADLPDAELQELATW
jgi:2-hydroxychromene-2-carboxylate isomerase